VTLVATSEGRSKPRAGRGFPLVLVAPLVAGVALALAWTPAAAADLEFSASVDQTTVGLGEQFQLSLTVQGEDMLSVPQPTLPPLPDFSVIGSTSSQSTNISIVNGQMKKQATVSFIYALAAKKLGKLLIPACRLQYQGRTYETQPIEITVVKSAQRSATPAPAMPGAPPSRASVPIEGNLFLSALPDRNTVYVGEPVTLEVSLGTRFQLGDAGWAEMPSFDGFWAEKIFDADRFDFQRRTIDGKSFAVAVLKKVALFPLSAGKTTIKPMAMNVVVQQAPRDFFDIFGTSQNVRVESRPVVLDVLPLPEAGRPKEFTGGVGRFTIAAALDRTSTSNSEPVNLIVKVSGSGNLRMIEKPAIVPIEGLKILEPEVQDDAHVSGDAVQGTKTFRFPIIPQSDGKYEIPPVAIAYFDPQAKAYRTIRSGALEFSASGSAASAPLAEASGLKVLGSDIDYIKPDAVSLAVTPMSPPWWPSLLYLLGLGTVASAFGYRRHSERLQSDRGYARKSRSSGLVRRRLREAERLLRRHDEKGFHAALTRAVMGYVGDRFNIETHAMTRDQLRGEMERLQIEPETARALIEIVDRCEIARFSPGEREAQDPRRLFERARETLGRI
jgi:hypothetical protein